MTNSLARGAPAGWTLCRDSQGFPSTCVIRNMRQPANPDQVRVFTQMPKPNPNGEGLGTRKSLPTILDKSRPSHPCRHCRPPPKFIWHQPLPPFGREPRMSTNPLLPLSHSSSSEQNEAKGTMSKRTSLDRSQSCSDLPVAATDELVFPMDIMSKKPNLVFDVRGKLFQQSKEVKKRTSTSMRLKHIARIALCHFLLYAFVVFYILMGAWIFHYIEGEKESLLHETQREAVRRLKKAFVVNMAKIDNEEEIEAQLHSFMQNVSSLHISLDNYLIFNDPHQTAAKRWTFPSSVLFAFTILTTIGYGNVAPTTYECQVFTMVYGAFGIPLFLITIADIGRFSKTGIMNLIQKLCRKEIKKEGEQNCLREVAEVILVIAILFGFIAAGSAVLPLWEHQLTYFDSVYFSYMSLTTIGLGDIVPRRMDFLLPTLLYITIGLWLTTAFVEQLADVFRLVHYAGRQVKNVKGITIWLGGKRLSVGTLIQTVCRKVGMSDNIIGQINWDKTMEQALSGVQPPLVPIFPWHFADFVEHDPPLIDLSVDLDELESYQLQGSFYCSQFPMKGGRLDVLQRSSSQHSAPLTRRHSDFCANGKVEDGKH